MKPMCFQNNTFQKNSYNSCVKNKQCIFPIMVYMALLVLNYWKRCVYKPLRQFQWHKISIADFYIENKVGGSWEHPLNIYEALKRKMWLFWQTSGNVHVDRTWHPKILLRFVYCNKFLKDVNSYWSGNWLASSNQTSLLKT